MEALVSGAVKRYSSKRWRQRHVDRLRRSSLEANMRDNLLSFVDGHIFDQEARRAFSLAHSGQGIIPERFRQFWNLACLRTLLCAHLMLIGSSRYLQAAMKQ